MMKKRLYALLLIFCLSLTLFPITASATKDTTPDNVDQKTVEERIEKLKTALIGKYFTVAGTGPCTNHSGASCPNCRLFKVTESSWLKKTVDLVPQYENNSPFTHYYYGTPVTYGTQCAGFANFAGWYLFAQSPMDIVKFSEVKRGSFSSSTLDEALPGDIVAIGKDSSTRTHTMIYLSHDSSGVNVLDCNYYLGASSYKICEHKIPYDKGSNWKNVTISRATNYDTSSSELPKGSDYTSDPALAAKLDKIFSAYPPGTVFPATESVDGVSIGVPSSHLYSRGYQFARWCSYKLFGYVDSVEKGEAGKYTFTELLTSSQGKNRSVNELASLLKKGLSGTACGSHLRISYYRSYIVLKVSDSGITVLDADKNSDGAVRIYDLTYAELAEVVKAAHEKWPEDDDLNVFIHQPAKAAESTADKDHNVTPSDPPEERPTAPIVIVSTGIDPESSGTAIPMPQKVQVGNQTVELQTYALAANGGVTNYVKLRDLADILDGTAAQFDVAWSKEAGVDIQSKTPYTSRNGTEGVTNYSGDQSYQRGASTTKVDGMAVSLQCFALQNGAYTYYKLRDLGQALNFNVGWSQERGVFIEPDRPYDPDN